MARAFNEKTYLSTAIDKLTIFAVLNLTEKGEECAFERLVKECFDLFPKRFCLRRYSQWPDSNRVYLSMIRCRVNGWLVGKEKSGFKITEFGKEVAQDVRSQLARDIPTMKSRKMTSKKPRERGEAIISFIKKSKAFTKFINNKDTFNISEGELREMLGATRETPIRILKQNIEYYWNVCKGYKEKELLEFLGVCRKMFKLG
ncbi:MAG: hypothetical protein HY805_10920 [Nitrospirae bacterium]|nr:hypothetical protein [Nitrospirota bacterium]